MGEHTLRPIDILLVEDNRLDIRLARETLRVGKIVNSLIVVSDGVEAMQFLRREGEYAEALRPALILLDLNLPRKDGREVLSEIKSDPDLAQIPVIVFTSSHAEADLLQAYGHHAHSYITKPMDLSKFLQAVKTIEQFWLAIVDNSSDE